MPLETEWRLLFTGAEGVGVGELRWLQALPLGAHAQDLKFPEPSAPHRLSLTATRDH